MFSFIFEKLFGKRFLNWLANTVPECDDCRVDMQKDGQPYLFLIPVLHANTYAVSKEYYQRNFKPVQSVQHIPVGNRACRVWVLTCPECGAQRVLIDDFLKVRENEVLQERNVFHYNDFKGLLLLPEQCL